LGSSINLFFRVNYYFYPSILKSGTRAVLSHFFNVFEGVVLTLYVMDPNSKNRTSFKYGTILFR